MRRFTEIVILVLCSMACVQSQTDLCTGLSEKYGTCIANTGGVKGGVDAQYCKADCFSYLPQVDSANCLDASAEICASIKSCIQECTPGSGEECLEDEIAAYSCLYSGQLTENCTITCDGSGGGSGSGRNGDSGSGGNIDADDPKSSTSAASTMMALPVSVAALLVGAGLAV